MGCRNFLSLHLGCIFICGHGMKIIVCEAGSHSSKNCLLQKRNHTFFYIIILSQRFIVKYNINLNGLIKKIAISVDVIISEKDYIYAGVIIILTTMPTPPPQLKLLYIHLD